MKTAIYIENGFTQVVLTPENDFEQRIVNNLDSKSIQAFRGSFYEC